MMKKSFLLGTFLVIVNKSIVMYKGLSKKNSATKPIMFFCCDEYALRYALLVVSDLRLETKGSRFESGWNRPTNV